MRAFSLVIPWLRSRLAIEYISGSRVVINPPSPVVKIFAMEAKNSNIAMQATSYKISIISGTIA